MFSLELAAPWAFQPLYGCVITVAPYLGLRSEFGRPLVGVQPLGNAVPGRTRRRQRKSQQGQGTALRRPSTHLLRARSGLGARLPSSDWMAERTSAWTVDSSSSATCWSSRFIDFGTRIARKTISSSMMCFLAAGTAVSSLFLGRRNGRSHAGPQKDLGQVRPIDVSVILREHVIKRSRSPRSTLLSSNFSSHRKGVRP